MRSVLTFLLAISLGVIVYPATSSAQSNSLRQQQQQRLLEQQRREQQQQMEQLRRQQDVQRQRMQQQQRQQQEAMRTRQQQMQLQRQQITVQQAGARQRQQQLQQQLQQRRANTPQRNRQTAERAQVQQSTKENLAAGQTARALAAGQLRKLALLRQNSKRTEEQRKKTQKRSDEALLVTGFQARVASSRLGTPVMNERLERARANLAALNGSRTKLKGVLSAAKGASKETGKLAALLSRFKNCNGASCSNKCSFHGDTLVKTQRGMVPIRGISAHGDFVWARHETTGDEGWKRVVNHYSNSYPETIEIVIRPTGGGNHYTIRSNRIHPFFVAGRAAAETRSISVSYDIGASGSWIAAADLRSGDTLQAPEGRYAIVQEVRTKSRLLHAFNLTVADFHTYFVSGGMPQDAAVWVHNDCNYRSGNLFDEFKNKRNFEDHEAYFDKKLRDESGWTKKIAQDGNGIRYYNGKGDAVILNKGYPAGLPGGKGDEIHRKPYAKISQNGVIKRIPLE